MGRGPSVDRNLGRVLDGSYRLVRLLAEGASSLVYEAERLRSPEERVAIKLLRPGLAADPTSLARFRREAELAGQLGHPHIVRVLGFAASADGSPFMVMELLEGKTLQERLLHGVLPEAVAVRLIEQLGSGLQALHDRGVVHRNLEPGHVFLLEVPEPGLQMKLLGFGLAKIWSSGNELTLSNPIFGTPFYMAPEVAAGHPEEADHRADIFATAVIAYQCLTGRLPFDGATGPEVIDQICTADPPSASRLAPHLPADVDAVLRRSLAKRRADRHARVDALTEELCRVLRSSAPRAAAQELTPTLVQATLDLLDITEPMDVSPATDAPAAAVEVSTEVEITSRDLIDPELTPLLTPGGEPTSERTTPHQVPGLPLDGARPRRHRRGRWLAALLGAGLLALGTTLALLISQAVPEDDPRPPAAAAGHDAGLEGGRAPRR